MEIISSSIYILLCQNIYSGELSTFDYKCFIFFKQIDLVLIDELKIILIPDQEFLPSVVDYIKQSLELRKWGSHWSMYNFNYEYMTFLYIDHVYMFCNVVLYCFTRKGFICNKDYYYLLQVTLGLQMYIQSHLYNKSLSIKGSLIFLINE
jgi:hypothetical protein